MIDATDIIRSVRDLPSLPQVVMELQTTMQQEDIDTHALAARITLDSALTAKTLRLANSSFYGMPNKVTTIQQAISILGFHSIRTLVTACSVTTSFGPDRDPRFDFEAFWRHAIATAVCARVLAPHFKLNPDSAFTAGLLHDIGALVIVSQFPDAYQEVATHQREHDCQAMTAERSVLGIDHAAIGRALTAHWRFPPAIQEAVAEHHTIPGHGAEITLATVVNLANILAHALDLSGTQDDQVPSLSLALWHVPGLSDAAWDDVFLETEKVFNDMCQMLTP
jgi:putative nucleotidyltransferase with HDIG domain